MLEIIDIRKNDLNTTVETQILQGLRREEGSRSLPTILLYDRKGLQLFEAITYMDAYYLTGAEIQILKNYAENISKRIPDGCVLLELGSGNLRKIEILLNALERAKKSVEYFALDLSLEELNRTLMGIPHYQYVKCRGLHGTYDDGLSWLEKPANRQKPVWIMSMGSSLGNFAPDEAASFLYDFAKLLDPSDSMLVGLDGTRNASKVFNAYSDKEEASRQFYVNALSHANSVLGRRVFKQQEWGVTGNFDAKNGCYKSYFIPFNDVDIDGLVLKKGEKIFFEQAYKYTEKDCEDLWKGSCLTELSKWGNSTGEYFLHLLSPAQVDFPMISPRYAPSATPTLQEYEQVWWLWDTVIAMVPKAELLSKPIDLRHPIIFYLGHIPTFLDIHLSRATGLRPTNKLYLSIFERGIDPDVDNPEVCHPHSEVPERYPLVEEILQFDQDVRKRTRSLITDVSSASRPVSEALWIGFEHTLMHVETLLYMLLQSDRMLPPPHLSKPNFESIARDAALKAVPNKWFDIPEQIVTVGLDDPHRDAIPTSFGWDNEKPRRTVRVSPFRALGRPITNGEYARYLEENHIEQIPASWVMKASNGDVANGHNGDPENGNGHAISGFAARCLVRTVFGPVPLRFAQDWPVSASYGELAGYAKWLGCRIPSSEEVQSIYQHAATLGAGIPNGVYHVSNGQHTLNGTNGNPGSAVHGEQHVDGSQLYVDLDSSTANVGFKHWHPLPVTGQGNRLCGRGEFGGLWEWTSSPLLPHHGFRAMGLYPGYTADFFDGKHNICLGGSWATHPRIAGRTTFVNWYQRNYPYPWAGARLVRDN